MKRIVVIGLIALAVLVLACGIGGFLIYRGLAESSDALIPELARAERNGIPVGEESGKSMPPGENAALNYKKAFDAWNLARPKIEDERWTSYLLGQVPTDEQSTIESSFAPVIAEIKGGASKTNVQWLIDESDMAFGAYAMWTALVDGVEVWLRIEDSDGVKRACLQVAEHIYQSGDPGSLRAAASIRLAVLNSLGRRIAFRTSDSELIKMRDLLERQSELDPLPVWRKTAALQLFTWEAAGDLDEEQKKLFQAARRDHGVIIRASSTEILEFWNEAIESSQGKSLLQKHLLLVDQVTKLRAKTHPEILPLQQLWTLPSATVGAGSLDWLIAEEQRQLTLQAIDVLLAGADVPESFVCKRASIIGGRPFDYERTASGFVISAQPAKEIPEASPLAQQSLSYSLEVK